jgi:hypothetical protein
MEGNRQAGDTHLLTEMDIVQGFPPSLFLKTFFLHFFWPGRRSSKESPDLRLGVSRAE